MLLTSEYAPGGAPERPATSEAKRTTPPEARDEDRAGAAAGEPPEPLGTRAETIGTVKYWRDAKGTGAIASEATAPWDIWCGFPAIEMEGFKTLIPGERVAVEYYRGQ